MKLVGAWNLTPSWSMLVVYLRLKQSSWVLHPLVISSLKLHFVVGGGEHDQKRINTAYIKKIFVI